MENSDKTPIIQIKNLSKVFDSQGTKVVALDDFTLDIYRGDIYGVIGMSGAGKSTLVRCINALEKPTSGTVIFDGKDHMDLSGDELNKTRRSMSMIFQQFNLLAQRSAINNVCFPLEIAGVPRREAKKKARELLELVGIAVKEGNENDARVQTLINVLNTNEVRDFINSTYEGRVVPVF